MHSLLNILQYQAYLRWVTLNSKQKNKQLSAKDNSYFHNKKKAIIQNADKLQITSENAFDIFNLTVTQSVKQLNQGKLTSQQLLTALAYRTITLAKQLNLFTYLYYRKSLQIAIKCDQYRKQTKKKNITLKDMVGINQEDKLDNYLPSLYGIPISIKDVYHLQGRMASIGLITNSMKQHDESPLILCFRNAGMIPFVQTNVPQFGMAMETGNNLWGRAKNPWNTDRAVGGSSGGQGGMISLRCSILGVGSDIGGSVRIPAEHCGVFGLKPHSKRISNSYHACLSKSFQSFAKVIPNCIGPLARSAQDLALFMQIVTNKSYYQQKHDPYTPIIKFNPQPYLTPTPKKTRIGYLKHLQDLQPSPASQRALNQTLQLLQQDKNIELCQIQIPNQKQIIRQFIRQYLSCKGKNYRQMLNGQKEVKEYRAMFLTARMRAVGKFVVGGIARIIMPRTYFYYFQRSKICGVMEYQGHVGEIEDIRRRWMEYWKLEKLDFVVAPGFGCQAFLHQQSETLGLAAAYTYIWNVLDMAVGSLPVTRVRQNEQDYQSKYKDILTRDLRQVARNSKGLPVGVQIIGMPYEQQRVLGLMNILQQKINFNKQQLIPAQPQVTK